MLRYDAEYRGSPEDIAQYIMRHGDNDSHDAQLHVGWSTIGLNANGKQQAADAAQFLKGKGIRLVVTSDLVRCAETADIVAQVLGVSIEPCEGLRDWNKGIFQGTARSSNEEKYQQYKDNPDLVIPNGESRRTFLGRTITTIAQLRIRNAKEGPILIVASKPEIKLCLDPELGKQDIELCSVWQFNDSGFVDPVFALEGASI